jgi:hypothetical protein
VFRRAFSILGIICRLAASPLPKRPGAPCRGQEDGDNGCYVYSRTGEDSAAWVAAGALSARDIII